MVRGGEDHVTYADGQEVRLGDRVWHGAPGVVVVDIAQGTALPPHVAAHWDWLKIGVIIVFPDSGPVHFASIDDTLRLVSRSTDESR
jgi:hypothetical protein